MNDEDANELKAWRQLSTRLHTQSLPGAEPLYPCPDWPKDVALVGFMLHKGLQRKEPPAQPQEVKQVSTGPVPAPPCVNCKHFKPDDFGLWQYTERTRIGPWYKFKWKKETIYKDSAIQHGKCMNMALYKQKFDPVTGKDTTSYYMASVAREHSCKGRCFKLRKECDKLVVSSKD